MRHNNRIRMVSGPMVALWMALAVTAIPLRSVAKAQTAAGGDGMLQTTTDVNAGPADETERWWGALGGVLCATEIRLAIRVPAIGMNPYVMAAGIAGCALAAIDILSTT